ncbi:HEAT repeat protein [Oesophagostomum dentatum]|uniref:HEAT repeat protein n=1 Tax=Oesophagostomum dentatum TaxID=61180 RepID=A0A0B1TG38_OESDE|nr:HEAT repeat protein [Oesophagostomum dentatum]
MASVLSSFFSRDPKSQFPYDIPQGAGTFFNGCYIGDSFKKAEPEELATIFWSSGHDSTLKMQGQKLRTMRHPDILTYQDSIEPYDSLFKNALKFLHEANLSHENVRKSIYVTAGGDWKLSGFDRVTTFSSPRSDLNQLAIVLWEVFNGFRESITKPEAPGLIPHRLHDLYKKMATPAAARTSVAELIQESRHTGGYFKNKFVDTLLFLEEFQLKDSSEKTPFFLHLRESLDIFPADIAKYKILPKIIETYEYGDAGPNILIPLFKLGRLLDENDYQRRVVPCLVKLFGSPDRTTRVKLLERIDEFAPHLSSQVINEKIFGNLSSGFLDTSPAVRESTVKAMVPLAEKLNFNNLNVELMKYLARLQGGDEHGGIRTNATICLGKIGNYLDPSKRQMILLSAFTRGMKLFGSPDRTTRVKLLERIDEFAPHLSSQVINEKIFGNLSSGFLDTSPAVRESTVKAMVPLAEKLNFNNLNVELMKYLARLQGGDEHGGIRTNATICLGKIGNYLDPSKRQMILLSAFTRGMKDPFPPARMAAVLALSATQQFYTLIEIANRVLPALSPLTCDPEKQVRDQAFKAIKGFMENLEKASEHPELIPEIEAQVKAGGRSLLNSEKVPQWAQWALKSLSGKFYKGTPPPEVRPAAASTEGGENAAAGASAASAGNAPASNTQSKESGRPTPTSDYDGWGDLSELESGSADEWADALEPSPAPPASKPVEDDWSIGWETPRIPAPPKASPSIGTKKLNLGEKKSTGVLKLSHTKPKPNPTNDIDSLLGITTGSTGTGFDTMTPSSAAKPSPKSDWDAFGNDDFLSGHWGADTMSSLAKPSTTGSATPKDKGLLSGDHHLSGQTEGLTSSSAARRAEIAARNEARRKEMAEKKAQRASSKQDPFPPARMAAVLALSATQQFYTLIEIANRVLPALSPLTCDPEKQVRDQAFKAIKGFMENLEKASEHPELIPEIEAQVKAGGRSLLNSEKVPQWAQWALKSLSGKFYKGTPPPEVRPAAASTEGGENAAAGASAANAGSAPASNTQPKESGRPTPTSDYDGWGDLSELESGSADEWADALEPSPAPPASKPVEDDWSIGWETPRIPAPPKASPSIGTKKLNLGEKKSTGVLKLSHTKPKPNPTNDIDSLLGITTGSIGTGFDTMTPSSAAKPSPKSDWDAFGNDDFLSGHWGADTMSSLAKPSTTASATPKDKGLLSGDHHLSGQMEGLTSSSAARRAEIAARNEARRREMAEKKAQRASSKQTTTTTSKTLDGFEDW